MVQQLAQLRQPKAGRRPVMPILDRIRWNFGGLTDSPAKWPTSGPRWFRCAKRWELIDHGEAMLVVFDQPPAAEQCLRWAARAGIAALSHAAAGSVTVLLGRPRTVWRTCCRLGWWPTSPAREGRR